MVKLWYVNYVSNFFFFFFLSCRMLYYQTDCALGAFETYEPRPYIHGLPFLKHVLVGLMVIVLHGWPGRETGIEVYIMA